jgi:PAS domain S-box-containing protein
VSEKLQILNLEDRVIDAELVLHELKHEGISCSVRRVWTEAEFASELKNPALGLILADYSLPNYDGLSALKLARRERPEVPFIFVTANLGEETAIDALHEGATDYVFKHRLNRLGPAVRRTLREARDRRQLAQAEKQLAENERRYRELFSRIRSGVAVLEAQGDGEDFIFKDFNAAAEQIEGVRRESLLGSSVARVFPGVREMRLMDVLRSVWKTGEPERYSGALRRNDRDVSWREYYVYKLPSGELVAVYDDVTERKLAEEKLRRGEERLRLALDGGQMGAWELDLVGGASWRTLRHDQIFGYDVPLPQWDYETLLKHVVPEDLELVKRCFAQTLFTDHLSCECRIAPPGRPPRWIAIRGRVGRNLKGERIRLMGTVSDISDRKLMEQTLRENEQRLRLLADNASDVIWTLDASGRLNYISPSVQRLLGYSAEEVLARGLEQTLVAASAEVFRMKLAEAIPQMQAGKRVSETLELKYLCKDGWTAWCEVGYSGMFDAANAFVGIVGVSRDVSERRRAEEERGRLVTAMEQAAESIVITDPQGVILYVNPAFEKITGYTRQEALGQNPRLLRSGKHAAAFYQEMWETITRGEVWHGRMINKRKDGVLFQEDVTISPVRDAAGRIVNFIALKLDVTREAELETQLRQSQRLDSLGTLAGGVAHEINNPINGIMNYAQLMVDRLAADHPLREYAVEIIKETERVSQIVQDLLSFARQDQRQHDWANLGDIVNSGLRLIRAVMRHDQITLAVDVPNDLPKVKCHSQQIQQVFLNLLTNARDALNEKYPKPDADKIIRVTGHSLKKEGGHWIRLTVEDHGAGVPPSIRDRVFDPFFTTKIEKGGTGLGLSISHGIAKNHRGKLHFETQTGFYTKFHLDLPGGD